MTTAPQSKRNMLLGKRVNQCKDWYLLFDRSQTLIESMLEQADVATSSEQPLARHAAQFRPGVSARCSWDAAQSPEGRLLRKQTLSPPVAALRAATLLATHRNGHGPWRNK